MFVKLFASLYQGTLRGCSDEILVFTNLLAHADQYGIVDKHWRAIAEETGLSRERVEIACQKLESPDSESRSEEQEGRRITRLDEHRAWGWKVVNYMKYRSIKSEDDRREQNRLAQERFRNKNKQKVSAVSRGKPRSAHTEVEVEKEKIRSKAIAPSKLDAEALVAIGLDRQIADDWISVRRAKKSPLTKTALIGVEREAKKAGMTLVQAIAVATERGWAGFKASWLLRDEPNGNSYESARDKSRREAIEQLTGKTGNGKTINGTSERVD